ncbi:MAG TPA: helix-hairpin-helix domain-containing protein [Pedobacter sp.]|jgi:hypothetical protein
MSFKRPLILGILLLSYFTPKCQTESNRVIEQIIESFAENTNEDFDYSEMYERLTYYSKNPLNLNSASAEQLHELVVLSPIQIQELLKHKAENGKFIDLLELQSIEALNTETIKAILPFCTLNEFNSLASVNRKSLRAGESEIIGLFAQALQKTAGYLREGNASSRYAGDPQRFLTRYKYHFGQTLSASLTMEKDAGEAFFAGAQKRGFDFYSGNISYKSKGVIQKIIVGDYSLQFGQGLTMWSGLSFGKGAAVASITKNNIGLKPYSSTNEMLFLRGVASTIRLKKFDITPFVSMRYLDGTLTDDTSAQNISSINYTGLHRTANEIDHRNDITQLVYGGNIQYTNKSFRLGATAYQTQFNYAFGSSVAPYKINEFAGDKLANVSLYYNYNWRNFYLFGESAHSFNSGFATLNGILASLSKSVSLIGFQRNYQRNYHSFFNQAVSEGSNAVNEKGFYTGLVISPSRKMEFNFYADLFKFPWLRYRVDAPSSGYELLSQFSYSPTKKLNAIFRYKLESKEENNDEEQVVDFLSEVRKQNYRFELSYKISDAFQIRNRVELVEYKKSVLVEHGHLIFQDIIYNPMVSKLSGNIRFALFDTPGFNSRLYAYENDVLYSYSMPLYQHRGTRFYVNTRYRINKKMDIWFKYAATYYSDQETIGSGLEEIAGNKKSDIKLQLRYQFR